MNKPINTIMVYIDGTEPSIVAAVYAICLASYTGAKLIVHYVINTKAMEDLLRASIFLEDEQVEYEHDMSADADKYLNYIDELAIKKGISIVQKRSSGSVHTEIENAVKENDVDLLVIGELPRMRSRRDEFFDETERAVRTICCSVLIVKNEDKVWQVYESLV